MLLLLILYVFIFLICYSWGAFWGGLVLNINLQNKLYYVALGMVGVTVVARFWCFWGNVGLLLQCIIVLGALPGLKILLNDLRKVNRRLLIIWLTILLLIVGFTSQQSISYDEALYHASFIHWLNDFGTLKGLGNLHGRLAFNSSWHLFAATFNFREIFAQPLNQTNGFFLLWVVSFFYNETVLYKAINGLPVLAWTVIVCAFFPTIFVYHIIDPSADFVVCFLAIILLYELCFFIEKRKDVNIVLALITLLFWQFSIKLSCFPVSLCMLYFIYETGVTKRMLIFSVLVGGFVIVPWLVSNYFFSGYLVYPSINGGLQPAWKLTRTMAKSEIYGIKFSPFERWGNLTQQQLINMSMWGRYKLFFFGIRGMDKAIFVGSFIGYITLLFYAAYKHISRNKILAIIIGFIGYCFVMLTVPDFRFVAPFTYFLVAFVLTFSIKSTALRFLPTIAVMACIIQYIISFKLYIHLKPKVGVISEGNNKTAELSFIFPAKYPVSHCLIKNMNGVNMHIFDESQFQFNWDQNPGTYQSPDSIKFFNNKLKDGIYIENKIEVR